MLIQHDVFQSEPDAKNRIISDSAYITAGAMKLQGHLTLRKSRLAASVFWLSCPALTHRNRSSRLYVSHTSRDRSNYRRLQRFFEQVILTEASSPV